MLEVYEPINVWAYFKGKEVFPFAFFWRGRQIKVEKVNLKHSSKEGDLIYYHFSLSADGNFYRIRFDSKNLKWLMEMVDED